MTRQKPRFSVVTITRNNFLGLQRTFESVEAQALQPFEWVVIDGASSDESVEWLSNLSYEKLRWVSSPDNGVFDAMNKALDLVDGDLVVFLNAGDRFSHNSVLLEVAHDWVIDSWTWGYGGQNYVSVLGEYLSSTVQHPFSLKRLSRGLMFLPHQATFVHLDLYKKVGYFDLGMSFAADQDMAIRLAKFCEPKSWEHILVDFEVGGLHSSSNYWVREKLYHDMRAKSSRLIFSNNFSDLLFVVSMGTYREAREKISDLLRYVLGRKRNPVR
jgi:glycosyltransferase involved in cell wall biosynthesis